MSPALFIFSLCLSIGFLVIGYNSDMLSTPKPPTQADRLALVALHCPKYASGMDAMACLNAVEMDLAMGKRAN